MGKKLYVPRWLHARKTIPADSIQLLDSGLFANTEMWTMQLHWLAVTGIVEVETGQAITNNFDVVAGGVARRLFWEIGISQKGDTATNYASTGVLFGTNQRQAQNYGPYDIAPRIQFPTAIKLPPDTGIAARMHNYLDPSTDIIWNPGLLINGYQKNVDGTRDAAQLAGFVRSDAESSIPLGSSIDLFNADLFNNGEREIYMQEMLLTSAQLHYDREDEDPISFPQLTKIGWRINPTSGPAWMPRPQPIPVGNIAPFNRGISDPADEGPQVYVFPDGVKLSPRQRVSVKIGNLSSVDQTLDISVFGLLEVQ